MPSVEHWIFKALDDLKNDAREQSRHQTTAMNALSEAIREEMRAKSDAAAELEKRVTIIETERTQEKNLSIKRGAWAGIFSAAGLSVGLEVLKYLFNRP